MDSSNLNELCECCKQPEDKQNNPAFQCKSCSKVFHLSCIANPPTSLVGDVLFEFTCSTCSLSKADSFVRNKMTWAYALILTLNHLHWTSQGIGNGGFFHYKTHIACFIDKNWITLFGPHFKQKKNWVGTLVGALSFYSGIIFLSSGSMMGDQGWWRLKYRSSPALTVHIIQEMAKDKAVLAKAKRTKSAVEVPVRTLEEIFIEAGYGYLLTDNNIISTLSVIDNSESIRSEQMSNISTKALHKEDISQGIAVPFYKIMTSSVQKTTEESVPNQCESVAIEEVVPKKRRMNSVESSTHTYANFDYDNQNSNSSYDYTEERTVTSFRSETYEESSSTNDNNYMPTTSTGSTIQQQCTNYDSDSTSTSPHELECQDKYERKYVEHKEREKVEVAKREPNKTSLFSKEPNSIDLLPWIRPIEKSDKSLMRLTEYEEIQLLKNVEAMIPEVKTYADRTYLRRVRAKLALRRLKRNKHLPLFDLDNTVKYLAGYSTEDPRLNDITKERVLDRFQSSYMFDGENSMPSTILVGNSDFATFQSPYNGTILKPFIRRDTETSPLWLRVMEELLLKANKNNPQYVLPRRAPIDYSYVKPQHIAAVNNLCSLFFWPGVDVSESLQYPEFSCVVTYKKLLIGFAFLVPDTGLNAAYIPFVLTRPEWRRSNIATFMLYHLLQTCTGQDVTLHVSPTNSAVFLYQKFGFKVEELVQDFYEKYFEVDSKVCKHALLLRLTR